MKTPTTNFRATRLSRITSAGLVLSAAMLILMGLTAESSSENLRKGQCLNWPSKDDKPKVANAFDTALKASAMPTAGGRAVRRGLLRAPVSTMNGILKKLYPKDNITFPKYALLKFFEPENPQTVPAPYKASYRNWHPHDHCIHIFYLPEVGKAITETDFQHNLVCCYPPWADESKRVNKP